MRIFLDFLASALIGVMAGLGVGGGGLLIIYLTLLKQMPQLPAQGINLLFFLCAAASSLVIHFKQKRIDCKLLLLLAPLGVIGSILGSFVAARIAPQIIRKFFAGLLIVSGIIELCKRRSNSSAKQ